MRFLAQTTRVAQLSLFIAIVPIALAILLVAAPNNASILIRKVEMGKLVSNWWWWFWAPTYLVAKGLFFVNGARKNRSEVKAALPWMIAINIALIFQIIATAVLGSRLGR